MAIAAAATRGASLTAQLLAYSRRQAVRPEVLELNATIEGIEPTLRRLIGANIRLVIRPGPETGRLRADHDLLDQILVNLANNARDAMPDGGTLTIESGNVELVDGDSLQHLNLDPGQYVYLVVGDTGQGIDLQTREHIVEPLVTARGNRRSTGLGLATIYGIVQQAGGHIWVYSEPGMGSSFKLYFPRVDAPASAPQSANAAPASVGTGTVLVVEDEASIRDLTSTILRRAGYDVTTVSDGADALKRLNSLAESIDVLVTDVVMPGMSGIELAERVLHRFPEAGVVLLSGYTAETLDLDSVVSRGAQFLSKPVTGKDLLDAVGRSRERRQALSSGAR